MRSLAICLALLAMSFARFSKAAELAKPLRGLYVTGGCCHDYNAQKVIIPEGVSARANVTWTVIQEGGTGTRHVPFEDSIYQKADWAKGFDFVVHNECFSDDADPDYIERFLRPHREGLPAIVIHCAMHTFRALKDDRYREFLGVESRQHGPQHPLDVKVLKPDHPVMKGFPADFKTGNEELYSILKVFPSATVLATAADKKRENNQWVPVGREHAVIWVNTYGQARVFGTTMAHNNKTLEHPAYLDMLTRGILWACGKLDEQGRPQPGYDAPRR